MKYFPWILLGLALLALMGFIGFYVGDHKPQSYTVTQVVVGETPTPIVYPPSPTSKSTWKVLTNGSPAFKVSYPEGVDYQPQSDGSKVLSKWGPTQKADTEFYDGISLNFKAGSLDGKTIKQFADQKAAEMGGVFETSPVTAATLGQLSGYKFHVKGMVEGDYYYLDLGTNSFLEVFDATKDPTNAGLKQTSAQILATLSL